MRSTDSGMRGPWGKIVRKPLLPAPPVPPPVRKAVKGNGVVFPVPLPAPATVGGSIQIEVTLIGPNGGLINVSVQVQVNQGDTQQQIDQKIKQALDNQGLRVRDVQIPTPLGPNNFQTCYGIDRTFGGEEVIGIGFDQDQLFLPEFVGVGLFVEAGATEFGDPFMPPGLMLPPLLLEIPDQVQIGSTFHFQVENGLPGLPGGLAISGVLAPLELLAFGIPDMWLYPGLPVTLVPLGFDPLGNGQVPLPVPPDPSLVGVELFSQAFVFDTSGVPLLSNGLQLKVGQ